MPARAAEIIDRVRALFKKTAPQWEPVNINELIREIALLLQNEIRRHLWPSISDLRKNLPEVMADRVQLQQVLMNLMLNAIEAMQGVSAHLEINSQRTDDGQLLIAVSETGFGLPLKRLTRSSTHSSPPNRRALAWGSQLAVYRGITWWSFRGPVPTPDAAPRSDLHCRTRSL